jgi:hypothetical protein
VPQPYFVPVIPSTSRNTHSSGVSPSTSTLCFVPLTLIDSPNEAGPQSDLRSPARIRNESYGLLTTVASGWAATSTEPTYVALCEPSSEKHFLRCTRLRFLRSTAPSPNIAHESFPARSPSFAAIACPCLIARRRAIHDIRAASSSALRQSCRCRRRIPPHDRRRRGGGL